MAKPTPKFSNEHIATALEQAGGIYVKAAAILRCDRETIAKYVKRSPVLQKKLQEIVDSTIDMAEASLLKNISKGNVPCTIFYLKTKGKHRGYTEKPEIDPGNNPQQYLSHEDALKQLK